MLDLDSVQRQARSVEHLEHRPWPLPGRGWTMGQTWEDILFAHWRVPFNDVLVVAKGVADELAVLELHHLAANGADERPIVRDH